MSFSKLGIDLDDLPIRYGYHQGHPKLRELIAEDYEGLTAENVVVTNGAAEALFTLSAALLKPGDHVIVEHPNYPSNYEVPRSLGCKVDFLELRFEKRFKPDITELENMITPKTKFISITHPNNPTGSMITKKTLEKLIEIAESNNCYLISDKTYRELSFKDKLPPAASLSPKAISISTMSKAYGLPGIRIGWIATQDKKLIESIIAIREQVTICNSAIGEAIAIHVLENKKKEILEYARKHAMKNLKIVEEWIERQSNILEWIKPEAGVVAFPRFKNISIDPEKIYVTLAEKYKTFVIPGRCFEMDNYFFRIGYGGNTENLTIGLKNIERALRELIS